MLLNSGFFTHLLRKYVYYIINRKKVGSPDSVIEVYDRGCKVLETNRRELITLSLVLGMLIFNVGYALLCGRNCR